MELPLVEVQDVWRVWDTRGEDGRGNERNKHMSESNLLIIIMYAVFGLGWLAGWTCGREGRK